MTFEPKFKGENYEKYSHLYGTELLNVIRRQIKETFPEFKFKIRKNRVDSFSFNVMAGPIDLLTPDAIVENNRYSRQVNPYWIHDPKCDEGMFTSEGRLMLSNLCRLIGSFNFDDSDIQSDYFHTNFYFHVEVGDWDDEYKKIDKKNK